MSRKLVKESKYVNFFYEEENQIITAVWLSSTEDLLDEEEYKDACLLTAEVCEEYKPKRWLVDNTTLFYMIPPNIQEWIDKELTIRFSSAGLQKMAIIIVSPDNPEKNVFENAAMEQLMEEENTKNAWVTKFFSNEKSAHDWLLS